MSPEPTRPGRTGRRRGRRSDKLHAVEARLRDELPVLASRIDPVPPTIDQVMGRPAKRGRSRNREASAWRYGHPGRPRSAAGRVAAWSLAAVLLLGAGAVGGGELAPVVAASSSAGSSVGAGAVAGPVAWVSRSGLHAASSAGGAPALLWRGRGASSPQWSHDGQWIAFVVHTGARDVLWTERADGKYRRVVARAAWLAFMWSPTSDTLAVSAAGAGLRIYPVQGRSFAVLAPSYVVSSFAWSSTGSSLAVSVPADPAVPTTSEQVLVLSAYGGSARPPRVAWTGPPDQGVIIHSWWPDDQGVVLWLNPGYSGSAPLKGLKLYSLALAGPASLRYLATTVVYFPWVVWSPGGDRLAVVQGGGEPPWSNKSIAVCRIPSGLCSTLPQPRGTVSISPAWSPDGTSLAFVSAPAVIGRPATSPALVRWYRSRQLWVSTAGSAPRPVAGAPRGVAAPAWVEGGTAVGFSTPSSVGVVPSGGGRATAVATDLRGNRSEGAGPDGYGKRPWGGTAVWNG